MDFKALTPISEIVSSLALGIAKAQAKLDDNSIAQLKILEKKPQGGGKSLLELGFSPTFYAFEHADISVSIRLNIAEQKKTTVDLGLTLDYAKKKGYSKDDLEILENSRKNVARKEFKSTKSLLVKASETKKIKIQNTEISMDQTKGSMLRVEDFADKMSETENIVRVNATVTASNDATNIQVVGGAVVNNSRGYIVINYPTVATKWSILQIKNYNAAVGGPGYPVKLKNAAPFPFLIGANFADTLSNANTNAILTSLGTNKAIIPISSKSNPNKTILEIYFDFNKKDKIDESYSKPDIANNSISYSNTGVSSKLNAIARLLKSDPTLSLTIEGHTDSSGPYTYNDALGLDRAETVKKYFTEEKKLPNTIVIESKSESVALGGNASTDIATNPQNNIKNPKFRKVVIKLTADADYILFQGDIVIAELSPASPDVNGNGFIGSGDITASGSGIITFNYGTSNFTIGAFVDYAAFSSAFSSNVIKDEFTHSKVNETIYLLHNKSKIEYIAYNANTEEITIEEVKQSSSNNSQDESTFLADDTITKNYELKKTVEKTEDPSSLAFGATLDVKTEQQFNMTSEGNASISVRLKAVLPPAKFAAHVLALTE
jgi:outer membrane protein OmpA-like peptidoglycan-associated protein